MSYDYIIIDPSEAKIGDEWSEHKLSWHRIDSDGDLFTFHTLRRHRNVACRRHRLSHEIHELRKHIDKQVARLEDEVKVLEGLFLAAMDPHRIVSGSFTISVGPACWSCGHPLTGRCEPDPFSDCLWTTICGNCGCITSFVTTIDLGQDDPIGGHVSNLQLSSGKTYPLNATFNGLDAGNNPMTGPADPGGTYTVSSGDSTVQMDGDGNWTIKAGAPGSTSTVNFSGAFDGFAAEGTADADVADVPVSGEFTISVGPAQVF